MDLNLVVIAGRLATDVEVSSYETTSITRIRLLVTVRHEDDEVRRIDVIPVTWWNVPENHPIWEAKRGDPVWVAGRIQRRFWTADNGKMSRIEVIAEEVSLRTATEADEVSVNKTATP